MNILITGAGGFVGQALCKRITHHSAWDKVISVSRKKLNSPCANELIHYHTIVSLQELCGQTELLSDVDCIVHLAARVHQMNDLSEDPLSEFRAVNTEATCLLATAAAAAGVRRFIYLSSIKVIGDGSQEHRYTELSPQKPADPYALSKWEAEQKLKQIAEETGLEVVIIRPPLVYGENVKANFQTMLKVVQKGIPLPVALIQNKRSLIYVENLVDAILTTSIHPKASNQTFLVSDGEDVSTPQLIIAIANALERPAKLLPIPVWLLTISGMLLGKSQSVSRLTSSLYVDSSKLKNTLNWKPPFTFDEGIKKTVEWFLDTQIN